MLSALDQAVLGGLAGRSGPSPKELFQAARDQELANHRFSKADVDNFDRFEARQDVIRAVRKDLVPLQVEGVLNRSYDEYFASGCADVSWTGSE